MDLIANVSYPESAFSKYARAAAYGSGLPQKMFGSYPTMDSFLLASDQKKAIVVTAELSTQFGQYLNVLIVRYWAAPLAGKKPMLSKLVHYGEVARKFDMRESVAIESEEFYEQVQKLVEHRRSSLELVRHRNALAGIDALAELTLKF